jgi:hypothetical protein
MSFSHLLIQRCEIYRRVITTNDYGHKEQVYPTTPLYKDVPCRFEKIGNYTSTLAQTPTGQTSRNEGLVFFESNADVRAGDRVILDGVRFTVTPSLNVFDGVAMHHKEVYVSIEET